MLLPVISLVFMFGSGCSEREKPYIDSKLVKISAHSSDTLDRILRNLQIDVLSRNHDSNFVAIVKRKDIDKVINFASNEGAVVGIIENNLQRLTDQEYRHLDLRRRKRQDLSLEAYVTEFLDLDEIYEFQERVVSACSNLVELKNKTIGYSANNRPIQVLQISKESSRRDKKTIFIEAGTHAREWLSSAAANYAVYQLACVPDNQNLLDLFNWEVISVMNPDGYQYTHTSGHRYWRKNRQVNEGSNCIGTDINRNFESGFGEGGSSNDRCSDDYRGEHSYSTPESKALRDHILATKDNIVSYVALHSYGQYILLPWGYKNETPSDYEELMALAKKAESAMGVPFKIGPSYSTIYPASGVSLDFAREAAGIKRAYTWELMPDDAHGEGKTGFSPEESKVSALTPVIWRGLKAYVQALANLTSTNKDEGQAKDAMEDPNTDLHGAIGEKGIISGSSANIPGSSKEFPSFRWYSLLRKILQSKIIS